MDELIRQAIAEKRLLQFQHSHYLRIAEPHVYGRKSGRDGILVFQIGGGSSTGSMGWKRMYLKDIAFLRLLDETFLGKRNMPGPYSRWDVRYAIVG